MPGACCVLSIAVPFGLHIYYKWPGTLILPGPENGDPNYFDKNYIVPWCRFSPYVGGVVMGYILYRTKDKQIRIPRVSSNLILMDIFMSQFKSFNNKYIFTNVLYFLHTKINPSIQK